ncbi:amidohydrolase [Mycolicibacterium madagascariense]|uniref:Amidohydrolase n=1 Tax=Mycolicibacterium madagascariense TaxID=212765 RepID=A0A7I7XIJ3_9MYCO|nr:amidohydrolase family protein [Mycolicibacterium madagascariense]MCV7011097.1 amidohydrolase family protein [Mycolicibacterium madagascariense]BBZ29004.1 amidohydrolase [Mycolicibacterium madagascariense]
MTTLLVGGRVYSSTMPDATAMAVSDGPEPVVSWLGADDVGRRQFPGARVVDLDGAFVTPAFVDSHVHVTATGLALVGLDLRGARSRDDALRLLAEHAHCHPTGPIWGHGWDEARWPQPVAPTTADLDRVLGDRPAYLARVDVHSAAASSALRRSVPDLESRAGHHDQLPLTAEAHHAVRAAARGALTQAQRDEARVAALDLAARSGIAAVHECAGPEIGGLDDWRELDALRHGVEVIGYWGEAVTSADQARELLSDTGVRGLAGDLFVDGALGSRTAWLLEPYHDAPDRVGNAYLDADAIEAHVDACTQAGITAGFHVIGDAAVAAVVEAFARVVDRHGAPAVARCGHRLEHVEMIDREQAGLLGSWGVIASMQPNFDALWGGTDGMYAQRLGAERAVRLNPLALLASQGVPLAFGSDTPVTGMNPWETVRAATTHRTPGSAMSARAAFAAATRGAWRAGGARDGVAGTLTPGAPATYAVWDLPDSLDALEVAAPTDTVQRWSTDPRSRIPALPRLSPDAPLPVCRQTVHRGVTLHG